MGGCEGRSGRGSTERDVALDVVARCLWDVGDVLAHPSVVVACGV